MIPRRHTSGRHDGFNGCLEKHQPWTIAVLHLWAVSLAYWPLRASTERSPMCLLARMSHVAGQRTLARGPAVVGLTPLSVVTST